MADATAVDTDWSRHWITLAVLLLAAFASRLAAAIWLPSIHHPDEIFQALEQAHRVVFGYGMVPWEFRDGARSWLLAGALTIPMWIGDQLAPGTLAYQHFARALIAAISASIPAVGYWWCRRFGPTHALLAGLSLLIWFELIYYGSKTLSEIIAGAFLFAGVLLCSDPRDAQSARRVLTAGFLLGAAFAFRFHLAPAIAMAALWMARGDLRRTWPLLLAGGALPVAVLGIADWLTWSVPFNSIINNFHANIIEGRSHIYGTSPWHWYAGQFVSRWGAAALVLAALALLGARKQPLPLLVALIIVVSHSAIAHKEYRFLYPAIPLFIISAALGAAQICRFIAQRQGRPWGVVLPVLILVTWGGTSLALALAAPNRVEWTRGHAGLELMRRAGQDARCGIALLGAGWDMTGGYFSIHRDIPLHLLYEANRADWDPASFDVWIAPEGWLERQPLAAGFQPRTCQVQNAHGFEYLCLWQRPGGCSDHPVTEAQRVMLKYGF